MDLPAHRQVAFGGVGLAGRVIGEALAVVLFAGKGCHSMRTYGAVINSAVEGKRYGAVVAPMVVNFGKRQRTSVRTALRLEWGKGRTCAYENQTCLD